MPNTKTSYDAIPYPTVPFPESHPDRLAAIAALFGLEAPAPAGSRILELGCSMGGNLVAIAQMYPQSRCVGIDASSHQIAERWKTIGALGARNIELRHLDGRTDCKSLPELLVERLRDGEFVHYRENDKTPVTGESGMRSLLDSALDKVLANLARQALFLGDRH